MITTSVENTNYSSWVLTIVETIIAVASIAVSISVKGKTQTFVIGVSVALLTYSLSRLSFDNKKAALLDALHHIKKMNSLKG